MGINVVQPLMYPAIWPYNEPPAELNKLPTQLAIVKCHTAKKEGEAFALFSPNPLSDSPPKGAQKQLFVCHLLVANQNLFSFCDT